MPASETAFASQSVELEGPEDDTGEAEGVSLSSAAEVIATDMAVEDSGSVGLVAVDNDVGTPLPLTQLSDP